MTEKMLADVAAIGHRVLLVLAIDDFTHALHQSSVGVALEQRIPIIAPDHLDDVPACTPEGRFELLNDLAVAPHRAVQPLQIAVDDPDQVVEVLA